MTRRKATSLLAAAPSLSLPPTDPLIDPWNSFAACAHLILEARAKGIIDTRRARQLQKLFAALLPHLLPSQ